MTNPSVAYECTWNKESSKCNAIKWSWKDGSILKLALHSRCSRLKINFSSLLIVIFYIWNSYFRQPNFFLLYRHSTYKRCDVKFLTWEFTWFLFQVLTKLNLIFLSLNKMLLLSNRKTKFYESLKEVFIFS